MIRSKVNLFILGAPKCGTTALSNYLAQHPSVCMSKPKETNFFCTDFPLIQNHPSLRFRDVDDYHARCFPNLQEHHSVICDATVWNLYSQDAVKNILNYNPDAKFVVMIRNPITMIFSLHSMYVGLGFEKDRDFLRAFQRHQLEIHSSAKNKLDRSLISYRDVGLFGEQLKRLYDRVPGDKVRLILYDDFSHNTKNTYEELLNFLNLPVYNQVDFSPVNAQRKIKNPLFSRVMRSEFVRVTAVQFKKTFNIKSFGIGIIKPPISQSINKYLSGYYQKDINILSSILSRDLCHWFS